MTWLAGISLIHNLALFRFASQGKRNYVSLASLMASEVKSTVQNSSKITDGIIPWILIDRILDWSHDLTQLRDPDAATARRLLPIRRRVHYCEISMRLSSRPAPLVWLIRS